MCLVKVKQEEDVVVPYRVVQRNRSPPRRHSHQSTRRISRTEVIRESPRPSASYIAVPPPQPLAIPAIPPPQPVPVFVEPPPAPAPPPAHHHYVEVSPRSSFASSSDRGEYVVREREYRRESRRDRSEERSPRYEHFRYVEPAPSESDHYERFDRRRSRSRVRERSVSRGGYEDYGRDYRGGGERERITRERISIVEGDGRRRRREYRD